MLFLYMTANCAELIFLKHKNTFALSSFPHHSDILGRWNHYSWKTKKTCLSCIFNTMAGDVLVIQEPGPRFNIKMSSYQYRKSHCGDKTVVRSSYLYNGSSYTGKTTSLYWIRAQGIRGNDVALLFYIILVSASERLTHWGLNKMLTFCRQKFQTHFLYGKCNFYLYSLKYAPGPWISKKFPCSNPC